MIFIFTTRLQNNKKLYRKKGIKKNWQRRTVMIKKLSTSHSTINGGSKNPSGNRKNVNPIRSESARYLGAAGVIGASQLTFVCRAGRTRAQWALTRLRWRLIIRSNLWSEDDASFLPHREESEGVLGARWHWLWHFKQLLRCQFSVHFLGRFLMEDSDWGRSNPSGNNRDSGWVRPSVCMCVHVECCNGLNGCWIGPLDAIPLDARKWIHSKTLLPHRLPFCQVSPWIFSLVFASTGPELGAISGNYCLAPPPSMLIWIFKFQCFVILVMLTVSERFCDIEIVRRENTIAGIGQ